MRRIYVASSWRNTYQPDVVRNLQIWGHKVYDFRNPPNGPGGFSWSEIDPNWEKWTFEQYRNFLLNHPRAAQGFTQDIRGMMWADTCVMVLPCGNSAHIEAGWMAGRGKFTIIFCPSVEFKPDLMYKLAHVITETWNELREVLE